MIENKLYPILAAALEGIIDDPTRIAPSRPVTDTALPLVVYYLSDDRSADEDQIDDLKTNVYFGEFTVEVWEVDKPSAMSVARPIKLALNGYRDTANGISRITYQTGNDFREDSGFHYDLIFDVAYKL